MPIFDARNGGIELESEYPCGGLPRLQEELETGDLIWVAFHSHTYVRTNNHGDKFTFSSMSIAWAALLSRGGQEAWDAVTESSPVPSFNRE